MKTATFILVLLFVITTSFAQSLPEITGETVENKSINLPADIKGKYSLLCFASSMKAQDDLVTWLDPVYQKFIAKTGLMDDLYDVNVYFIPVLTGTNLAFATSMKNKFKENAQADLQSHVLFCKKDGKDLLASLNMQQGDTPYFFLLDKESKIIYRTNGKFTEEKFDAIDELIE